MRWAVAKRWRRGPFRTLSALPGGRPTGLLTGLLTLVAAGLTGCGGPVMLEVQPIEPAKQVPSAPPQSAEERDGEVPPLRGLHGRRALVPKTLVPPAPPGDPEPEF